MRTMQFSGQSVCNDFLAEDSQAGADEVSSSVKRAISPELRRHGVRHRNPKKLRSGLRSFYAI